MKCPLCHDQLQELVQGGFACPKNEGVLLSGGYLTKKAPDVKAKFERAEEESQSTPVPTPSLNRELTCPHCEKPMQQTDYNGTGIIIDSCSACPYRWLDRGEFKKIIEFKPALEPDHVLAILDLDRKTQALGKNASDPAGEQQHFVSPAIDGVVRGYASGDSRRTMSYLFAASVHGLIKGMLTSKFMRIVGPFLVIGLLVLGYYLAKTVWSIDWSGFRLK